MSGNFFDDASSSDSYGFQQQTSSDRSYNLDLDVPQSPTEAYASLSPEEFEEHVPKINSVTLVGRIGQNPEPRYFDDGKVVLRLGLAVKRKYHPLERQVKNIKYGEEETDWFNLELWGRDAEYATKYITKGTRVGITGTLNVDAWTDRMTGEQRTSVKIVVKQLDILETKAETDLRQGKRSSPGYGKDTDYSYGNNDYAEDGPSSGGSGGFFDE
jgi:single-strand DNA-binding protein